ncbi:hypothetical protein FB45DRAFT_11712 [Roridomyces roridus]|uniref:Uncharacterized protein n=1 Tax=Roridomyces roridus TaxID=1738132 RepID=A0AAD7CIT9_9AGAR|nr:hypothetical protein FB45DRAFT_11712 [Roridomyces roridus]
MDRPFIITQSIYKLNCPPIRVHPIHESNLTQTLVQQFLDAVPTNGAVGVAPLYDRFFNLTAIALSAPERVLLVHLNTKAEHPRPRKGKNNASGRELLANLILCSERYTKYALFMDLVALSLFFNHRLRISHAVDLQDAVQDGRGSVAALVSIAGGEAMLNKANLTRLFVNDENEGVPIADLALQAWFLGRAASSAKLEMRVKHVVRIHTNLLSDVVRFLLFFLGY